MTNTAVDNYAPGFVSAIMEGKISHKDRGLTMPVPDGYVTKTNALAIIREQTGCGRFVAENKMAELAEAGTIRFVDNPGNRHLRLISRRDVDKVVAALTLPPPE